MAGNGSRTNDPHEPGFDPKRVVRLGDGGPATTASLVGPTDVSVDDDGNIFITDSQDQLGPGDAQPRIRRVDGKTGIITTIVGTGERTNDPIHSFDPPFDPSLPIALMGDSGPPTMATLSSRNFNILLDKEDRVLISDNGARRVRRIEHPGDDDD